MIKTFWKKYWHLLIVPLYGIFYMVAFNLVESREIYRYHIIHSSLDAYIPFCEYFVIPYFLWFAFIAVTVLWFMYKSGERQEYMNEYFRLIFCLAAGMTVFILVSVIYPNGHMLRPASFDHENICTMLVRYLYSIDTPTNVLPSIHVYNSIAAFVAIAHSRSIPKKKIVTVFSGILAVSICLATLFIKQHTVIDMITAVAMYCVFYTFAYIVFADDRVDIRKTAIAYLKNY